MRSGSKYHRQNHHTYPSDTNPDSGHDPIASYSNPFRGDFVLTGGLSAIVPPTSAYSACFMGGSGVGINTSTPNVDLTVFGNISASDRIYFNTLGTSLTSSGAIGTFKCRFPIYDAKGLLIGYVPIYI
jgi:hypothetical protein